MIPFLFDCVFSTEHIIRDSTRMFSSTICEKQYRVLYYNKCDINFINILVVFYKHRQVWQDLQLTSRVILFFAILQHLYYLPGVCKYLDYLMFST